jgi:hypothetical protein
VGPRGIEPRTRGLKDRRPAPVALSPLASAANDVDALSRLPLADTPSMTDPMTADPKWTPTRAVPRLSRSAPQGRGQVGPDPLA